MSGAGGDLDCLGSIDFRGDDAVANGWMRRARRQLAGLAPTPEHGWLAAHQGIDALLVRARKMRPR